MNEEPPNPLGAVVGLLAPTLRLAAMNTLLLWRQGAIPADELGGYADALAEIAQHYEQIGNDPAAAQYHALALRLRGSPPP